MGAQSAKLNRVFRWEAVLRTHAIKNAFAPVALVAIVLIGVTTPEAGAAQREDNADAELAARSWLTQMDVGAYDQAWEQASGHIHQRTKAVWTDWMQERRGTLGTALLRTTICVRPTTAQGTEPKGDTIEIEYDTDFAGLSDVFEYVKTVRGTDGTWKVCWYFVRQRGAADFNRCESGKSPPK
jgi:hypothetical protein